MATLLGFRLINFSIDIFKNFYYNNNIKNKK